jgi:hypothetical protein
MTDESPTPGPYHFGLVIVGPDGDRVDLRNDPNIVALDTGIHGLRHGPVETFTRSSASLSGQLRTGYRALPRDITLPIDVHSEAGPLDWLAKQRRADRLFRVHRESTLYVTAPGGGTRHIVVRRDDDEGDSLDRDPTLEDALTTVYELVADGGWFHGERVLVEFDEADDSPRDFYDPDRTGVSAGPAFIMTEDVFTGKASVTNPGDVEAWGVWEFDGPHTALRVTVDGQVIARTRELAVGHTLIVDTRDGEKVAWLRRGPDGTPLENVTDTFTSLQFASIEEGDTADVRVAVTGSGAARVWLEPRYFEGF